MVLDNPSEKVTQSLFATHRLRTAILGCQMSQSWDGSAIWGWLNTGYIINESKYADLTQIRQVESLLSSDGPIKRVANAERRFSETRWEHVFVVQNKSSQPRGRLALCQPTEKRAWHFTMLKQEGLTRPWINLWSKFHPIPQFNLKQHGLTLPLALGTSGQTTNILHLTNSSFWTAWAVNTALCRGHAEHRAAVW